MNNERLINGMLRLAAEIKHTGDVPSDLEPMELAYALETAAKILKEFESTSLHIGGQNES